MSQIDGTKRNENIPNIKPNMFLLSCSSQSYELGHISNYTQMPNLIRYISGRDEKKNSAIELARANERVRERTRERSEEKIYG